MVEDWELDFKWLRVQHFLQSAMRYEKLPDLNAVLMLIGVQEVGETAPAFSKEEKQDFMHVAVCTLLARDGYFEFVGQDDDNWPHFRQVRELHVSGPKNQERLLKEKIVEYFAGETASMTE